METLIENYKRLLQYTSITTQRYLLKDFTLKNRLIALIGARGTDKTTLLLQYIKTRMADTESCMYVSMDNLYFTAHTLSQFVKEMYEIQGVRYFFLDEIHKYRNWNQELKNMYDSYPDIYIVFSGSSSLDLIHGNYDLSRRSIMYTLHGLSFREYLQFKEIANLKPVNMHELLKNKEMYEEQCALIPQIRGHFKDYLEYGYYPFFMEDIETYNQKLFRVIEKSIYEDIASFYKLKTDNLYFFKKLLTYIATIPPGELNKNNLAKHSGIDNKTVGFYLQILQESGLASLLSSNKAQSTVLKMSEKIYLENSNLYNCVAKESGFSANSGTIREIFFISMMRNSGNSILYSTIGDFLVDGVCFEVGGKNKKDTQIKSAEKAYLIKDDILYGKKNEIPLHLFGMLY